MKTYGIKRFDSFILKDSGEVSEKIEKYFEDITVITHVAKDNTKSETIALVDFIRPPTIVGLSNALGISVSTFHRYREISKNIPELCTIEDQIREVEIGISTNAQQLSFTGKKPSLNYLEELKKAYELKAISNSLNFSVQKIEEYNNTALYTKSGNRGAMFTLKSNFGYSEKQEVEVSYADRKIEDILREELGEDMEWLYEKRINRIGWKKKEVMGKNS